MTQKHTNLILLLWTSAPNFIRIQGEHMSINDKGQSTTAF